jgi:hypothetical protein
LQRDALNPSVMARLVRAIHVLLRSPDERSARSAGRDIRGLKFAAKSRPACRFAHAGYEESKAWMAHMKRAMTVEASH